MTPAILPVLEEMPLHTEVVVEAGGDVVRGCLLDYSDWHLWLHGHDQEYTDHDRPWRARLSTVTAVTRVPDPPRWS
ncbi:hypothetical protein Q8791_30535 [Nocardiopsis sp. CT-R113]|uniref:Uncharacterized protein n=1 Tax=Nocardiopsis codii TaxID=3065942 RepID=A0ABU7KH61_9ACTN|nr:hypothetical protein [Nocardiopsis sp. CT-R113]MEE2041568.1 hypothetical protein [Nocardiopsis sp. CT-R113]